MRAAAWLRVRGRFGAGRRHRDCGRQGVSSTLDGKICAPCMIRGTRAAKSAPSWQDPRAVYPPTAVCGAFRMHGAHILPKPARFRMHGVRILPRTGDFPVRGRFRDAWSAKLAPDCRPRTHRGGILPRIDARERTVAEYCHYQSPENAFVKILPWTNAWIRPAPNNCRPPRKKNGAEGRTWRTPPPEARKTECWRGWGEQRVRRGAAPSQNTRECSAAKYRHGR